MLKGIFYCLDAREVIDGAIDPMGKAHGMRRTYAKLSLHPADKNTEAIQMQCVDSVKNVSEFRIYECTEYQRAHPISVSPCTDLTGSGCNFFSGIKIG